MATASSLVPEDPTDPGFDVLKGQIGTRTHYIHLAMAVMTEPLTPSEIGERAASLARAGGDSANENTFSGQTTRSHLVSMRDKPGRGYSEEVWGGRWQLTDRARAKIASAKANRADDGPRGSLPGSIRTKTSDDLTPGAVYTRKDLMEAYGITDSTINTGIFQPLGHDSVWLFVTEEKTADRTQYHDRLVGDELEWDGQTEGRKDSLIIKHEKLGLELLLFYRKSKKEHAGAGFVYEGPFRYVSHTGDKPKHFRLQRVGAGNEPPGPEDDEEAKGGNGQGYQLDSVLRKALEMQAMSAATRHFAALGYTVEDVSDRQPYDLRCRKGEETVHVEVKGTQSIGAEVILTAGEVEFARRHPSQMALFVLHSISAVREGEEYRLGAGEKHVIRPWTVADEALRPVTYSYSVPGRGKG